MTMPEDGGGRAPVPEWFGRGDEHKPTLVKSAARGGSGCMAAFVGLTLGVVGLGFGLQQHERVAKLERDRARNERAVLECQRKNADCNRARNALESAVEAPSVPAVPTPAAPVEPPNPAVDDEAEAPQPLTAAEISAVTRKLNPLFKRCFESALEENPNAGGRIDLKVTIDASGRVTQATATAPPNIPRHVARCVESAAKGARFPESSGPTAVSFPVEFTAR